jgi:putative flippase GtrA
LSRQLFQYSLAVESRSPRSRGLVLAVTFRIHYLVAATLSFAVGSLVCYALSVRWVFDEHRFGSRALEIALFVAIGVLGVMLNNLVMWCLVEFWHANYAAAKLDAAGVILLFNFSVRRTMCSRRHGRWIAVAWRAGHTSTTHVSLR